MGILDRFAIRHYPPAPSTNGNGKAAAAPKAQTPIATSYASRFPFWVIDDEGRIIREATDGGSRRGLSAYIANVLIYGAINYRMRKVAEAPLIPVDVRDSGNPWIEDHEIAPLLAQPNPDQTGQELLEETQMFMDLTGSCIWIKSRDRAGRVGELRAFHGDEFQVEPIRDLMPEMTRRGLRPRLHGRFRVSGIRAEPFTAEDVVFFRFPHPTDRFRGLAPVRVVGDLLGIGDALVGHVTRALENGAQVGGLFEVPADRPLSEEEYQRLDAIIRARYSGGNSYRPFLGEGGLKFHPMAHSFKDLQLGELWREVETAVCTAFSVRPELLPMLVGLENSPWSHLPEAKKLAYDECIIPLWSRYEARLTGQLLRDFDDDETHELRFDTSEIPALQDDLNEKADILVKVGQDMTRDERRAFLGLKPLTAAQRREIEEERAVPAPERQPGDEEQDAPRPGARSLPRITGQTTTDELQTALWQEVANPTELNLWLVVMSLLQGDLVSVSEIIRASLEFGVLTSVSAAGIVKQVDKQFAPQGEVGRRWRSVVRPYLLDATRAGAERAPLRLRTVIELTPREIAKYADDEAAFLISSVTETTRKAVRQAVADALSEGHTVDQLAARLSEMGEFGEARARLIAQTETTRVLNGAAEHLAAKYQAATGRDVYKVWNTQEDDRVRPEHEQQNKERRPVGETFANGVTHPSEPGCRCFLTWEVSDG